MKRGIKRGLIGLLSALCFTIGLTGCELLEFPSKDTTPPRIVFACNETYLAKVGTKFTIPVDEILVMDDVDEVSPTFSVAYGDEAVAVKSGKFMVEKAGVYTVTVSAKDLSGNKSEKTIEVHTSEENEVNSFDDQVRIDQTYTVGYAQTSLNTDEEYVKDGTGSLRFTVLSHEALGWPRLVVDNLPINDIIDYYSISFWAYNDGTEDVEIYLHRNDVSAKAKYTLPVKTWTKVEVIGRNYDTVFRYVEASSWGEPECGMCEDMKCFTFHIVNPANTPQYDIYVDSLQVNPEKVYDTLDLSAKVQHPVVGVEYTMPEIQAMLGQEVVDATITYGVYDANYNPLTVTDGKLTFETAGRYTLAVEATYGKVKTKKNYMLVCAPTRAENEIEFFEYDTALNFVRSEHFDFTLSSNEAQNNNDSTKSLKIGPSSARWGYLTLGAVPYADLEEVSYIWFYAKTDSEIKSTETPYIGIRDGGRNKVLKRMSLTNDWKCFTLTKDQLYDLGVESLNGLQISIELYDTTNPNADGGWCPVTFTTYVDNFSVGLETEPTEKAEGVLLDFANDRDLDNLVSSYISYNFYDLEKTTNGVGSLKVTCDGKWPEIKFGDAFAEVDLSDAKYICIDAYVPTLAENSHVKIGVNDKNYQKITTAGEWVTLKYLLTVDSLAGMKLNPQRVTDGSTVNLGTIYIGKIYLEYYEVDPEAETHVKPGNVLYDFYDREEGLKIVYGSATGEKVIMDDGSRASKLVKTSGPWDKMSLPAEIDEKFDVANVDYIYLDVYSKEVSVGVETRFTYYVYTTTTTTDETTGETTTTGSWSEKFVSFTPNTWTMLRIPVNANTPSLASIKFGFQKNLGSGNWQAIGTTSGEALYFREIGVFSNTVAYGDYTGKFESSMDLGIFRVTNEEYKILSNENVAYVKEGTKSLLLQAEPRWPIYYFTQAFIDWLNEKEIISVSFDVYIENTNGNITAVEGGILQAKWDQWYTVKLETSKITTSSKLQVNKTNASTNSYIYIDNMQFGYLDYTNVTESVMHAPLFSVTNTDYKMGVNTDKTYVNEGNYSLVLYAEPQWPIYYFTQTFIDWLNENNITSVSFDVYIENANGNITAVEGGILQAKWDQWYTVTLETSKITTSSKLQVNKTKASTNSYIYIDNMQFVK